MLLHLRIFESKRKDDFPTTRISLRMFSSCSPRLYCATPLKRNAEVSLESRHVHHLRVVLRKPRDAEVFLFNERDGEWRARLTCLSRKQGRARISECVRESHTEDGPWVLFSPPKGARLGFLVEKAVELGSRCLWPVGLARSERRVGLSASLKARAVSATEQSGRLSIPEMFSFCDVFAALRNWPEERRLLLCAETGKAQPLSAVLQDIAATHTREIAFLVGPAGGFETHEMTSIADFPFVTRVSLGPLLLRVETAVLSALAMWRGVCDDGRTRPFSPFPSSRRP